RLRRLGIADDSNRHGRTYWRWQPRSQRVEQRALYARVLHGRLPQPDQVAVGVGDGAVADDPRFAVFAVQERDRPTRDLQSDPEGAGEAFGPVACRLLLPARGAVGEEPAGRSGGAEDHSDQDERSGTSHACLVPLDATI